MVVSGGAVGAAMASGRVVYSEYTQGSDDDGRRPRLVRGDGTGDIPLPKALTSATVSPDGTRIAQIGLEYAHHRSQLVTWLRVTAGNGSAPVTVVQRRAGARGAPLELLTGPPVWSPDGTRVIVRLTSLARDESERARRLVCVVATRSCRGVGRAPSVPVDAEAGLVLRSDVVGWQAVDGPVVLEPVPSTASDRPVNVRCGTRPRPVAGEQTTVAGLPGNSFGTPLRLRGVPATDEDGRRDLLATSADALTTADGTLVLDAPDARLDTGRLHCASKSPGRYDDSEFVPLRTSLGALRLRLRAGGRTTTVPTPSGLRRGEGLRLIGTDTGGAVAVNVPARPAPFGGGCEPGPSRRVRRCAVGFDPASSLGGSYAVVKSPASTGFVQRAWRYRADLRRFEPVTTLSRAASRTLAEANDLAVASGDAVLAVEDGAIHRVPLDGGAPTTIARGRGISLDLSAW